MVEYQEQTSEYEQTIQKALERLTVAEKQDFSYWILGLCIDNIYGHVYRAAKQLQQGENLFETTRSQLVDRHSKTPQLLEFMLTIVDKNKTWLDGISSTSLPAKEKFKFSLTREYPEIYEDLEKKADILMQELIQVQYQTAYEQLTSPGIGLAHKIHVIKEMTKNIDTTRWLDVTKIHLARMFAELLYQSEFKEFVGRKNALISLTWISPYLGKNDYAWLVSACETGKLTLDKSYDEVDLLHQLTLVNNGEWTYQHGLEQRYEQVWQVERELSDIWLLTKPQNWSGEPYEFNKNPLYILRTWEQALDFTDIAKFLRSEMDYIQDYLWQFEQSFGWELGDAGNIVRQFGWLRDYLETEEARRKQEDTKNTAETIEELTGLL